MILFSEFFQSPVNASKLFRYKGLLSNEPPISFGQAVQFVHQIQFFLYSSLSFRHGSDRAGIILSDFENVVMEIDRYSIGHNRYSEPNMRTGRPGS
jgi:hypothetical protein